MAFGIDSCLEDVDANSWELYVNSMLENFVAGGAKLAVPTDVRPADRHDDGLS
jgi:hypothetical protein